MDIRDFEDPMPPDDGPRPFCPLRIHLRREMPDGADPPETILVRDGVGVYISPRGVPVLFDHESLCEEVAATEPPR